MFCSVKLFVLPTSNPHEFRMILTINSDYFPNFINSSSWLPLRTPHKTECSYQHPGYNFPIVGLHIYVHKNLQASVHYCWTLSFSVIRRHINLYIGGDAAEGFAASSFKGDLPIYQPTRRRIRRQAHRIVTFFSKSRNCFSICWT
jgi:hypothetical protein